jgi:hypothetical protein
VRCGALAADSGPLTVWSKRAQSGTWPSQGQNGNRRGIRARRAHGRWDADLPVAGILLQLCQDPQHVASVRRSSVCALQGKAVKQAKEEHKAWIVSRKKAEPAADCYQHGSRRRKISIEEHGAKVIAAARNQEREKYAQKQSSGRVISWYGTFYGLLPHQPRKRRQREYLDLSFSGVLCIICSFFLPCQCKRTCGEDWKAQKNKSAVKREGPMVSLRTLSPKANDVSVSRSMFCSGVSAHTRNIFHGKHVGIDVGMIRESKEHGEQCCARLESHS